jgi:hypothetical protein
MVKNAIRRLVLRYFPELGQRKHLPQLARIEKVYDLPKSNALVSCAFKPLKAADIQLLNPLTGEPLVVPVFEQVTLAANQSNESGFYNEPVPGMQCLIQYIDGLNSLPVITSILPWQTLVPEGKSTDVTMQQNQSSAITGSNGDWHLQTTGEINQTSQLNTVNAQVSKQNLHERETNIQTHDITKIDGNQVNEIMGALKLVVGEQALITALDKVLIGSKKQVEIKAHDNMTIETLKTLHAKATELAKVEGATVWLGDDSVNAVQILLDLISLVKDMNTALETHGHTSTGAGPPITKAVFKAYKESSNNLKDSLVPIVG